jgi:ATPase subunit of ABC transporter with duplicated ATPase domains
MIHIHNFSFSFENSNKNLQENIIQNLNLQIQEGEIYAILGSNGVGKTTILNRIWQHSFWQDHKSKAKLGLQKAFLGQDLPENLEININNSLDFYQILFEIYTKETSGQEIVRNPFLIDYEELLDWFSQVVTIAIPNFNEDFRSLLFDFKVSSNSLSKNYQDWSPGTKKKILLSILLASKPRTILIDELTNHLDFEAIKTLEQYLQNLDSAVLLVDHSSSFLSKNVKNWIYIPLNQDREPIIFKNLDYEKVLESLENRKINQQNLLKDLANKQKKLEQSLEMQQKRVSVYGVNVGAAVKHLKNRINREIHQNPTKDLLDKNQEFNFKKVKKSDKLKKNNLINVKNLEFKIGQKTIQTIPEFKVYQSQKIRINALNGRGKTSFLKILIQKLQNPNFQEILDQNPQYLAGEIFVNPQITSSKTFIFEQISNYPKDFTVKTYILQKLKWQSYQLPLFLKKLRLDKFVDSDSLSNLSLGEFIRLQFGILAEKILDLELIILDEPGNFLDVFTQQALVKLLQNYQGALILVTHDQDLVDKIDIDEEFELGRI